MRNLMACRILEEAEADLRTVIQSLTAAQLDQLESAQQILQRMAVSLGEIEAAARRDSSLPIKAPLASVRNKLKQAGSLSAIALGSIERRAELLGLSPAGAASKLCVEG